MVKLNSALLVLTTLAISVFASPIDANKVNNDLKQVAHDVSNLDIAVGGIGASLSLSQALGIKASVENTEKDIEMSTNDVRQVTSVSDTDAREIMGDVDDFVPTILHLLEQIEDKKAVFFNFPLPGAAALMKQVLQDMYARSTELSEALINAAPAGIKPHAIQTKNVVDAAFKKLLNDFTRN